jgi:hypothetical protein
MEWVMEMGGEVVKDGLQLCPDGYVPLLQGVTQGLSAARQSILHRLSRQAVLP